MLLFYVRHGDPIYNPDSLTSLGERQAEAVARRLALYGIDRVFASTSNRAILTSKPTCEILKKEAQLLDFCNENHAWREFTVPTGNGGLQWVFQDEKMKRLFVSDDIYKLGENWFDHADLAGYKFKEGMQRIRKATDEFFLSLGYEHDRENRNYKAVAPSDERIALFAHQGFGLLFLSSLLDIPYPQFSTHFDMTHTGVTVIEFAENDGIVIPRILTLSNDSHIYKDGLPTNYNNYLRF